MKYLSIDLEATGLAENCQIIEFAMIPFDTQLKRLEEPLARSVYIHCPSFEDLRDSLDPWVREHNEKIIRKAHAEGLMMSEFKDYLKKYLESPEVRSYFDPLQPESPDAQASPRSAAHPPTPTKPAIYHCISRVVDKRFAFGPDEKEKLRTFMRMYENFSGNRILTYCFMCNHIHLLVEITPRPHNGLSDQELLDRLRHIQSEANVALVAKELADARKSIADGIVKNPDTYLRAIHERFTWRMHDLSQFMQGFLQRYSMWHNAKHKRSGHLWEDRFKSVIVEDGVAAQTISAYIDLNPVRAGIVSDPSDYRWSGYGEAIGGGPRGNGKKARAGLVRAMRAHRDIGADDSLWKNDVAREYRKRLLLDSGETIEQRIQNNGKLRKITKRKGMSAAELQAAKAKLLEAEEKSISEIPFAKILRCRIRYFTDGAVIGSREFVNNSFQNARHRFGPKRKDGARKLKGAAAPAAHLIWSLRDLKNGI